MRVVSLFSGPGGLDLGFIKGGHEIIWANDIDEDSVKTYKYNLGDHIVLGDICNISSGEIPNCDIVTGGFPCQGFSVANMQRHEKDSRNSLYLEMLRVIKDKKPSFFLAENVKGILSLGKGKVIEIIIEDFASAGYFVKYKLLNAADYGVPQRRERVILIGIRNDLESNIAFPEPTHLNLDSIKQPSLFKNNVKPWLSIGDALKDIPEPEAAPEIPNHSYSKYKLRFNNYLGHRRVDPTKPAPTVTGRGDDRGGVVVIHHPNNHRRMSARELAITQSFPMGFIFQGTQSSAYRQIANAVPPLMAQALAKEFPMEYECNESTSKTVSEL